MAQSRTSTPVQAPRRRGADSLDLSLTKGVLYRPNTLQVALAYVANGDLPPRPVFRAPQLSGSSLQPGHFAALALGSFGFGLMLAGGLL